VLKKVVQGLGVSLLSVLFVPSPTYAYTVTLPYPLIPGTTASAAQVMADFTTLYTLVDGNLDATNLAATGGIYANQIIPTNSAQATFGGTQTYAFPSSITATTNISALNGFLSTSMGANAGEVFFGTSGTNKIDYGITNPGEFTLPESVNVTGQVNANGFWATLAGVSTTMSTNFQQEVGGLFYTVPWDANSTAGFNTTHVEHGFLTTAGAGVGGACATHSFQKPYSVQPTVVGILASATYLATLFMYSQSTTTFEICGIGGGMPAGATLGIDWFALGE
jgi:hypothetical protein